MLTYSFWQCNKHRAGGCKYVCNVKSLHAFKAASGFAFMSCNYFKIERRVTIGHWPDAVYES